MSVEKNVQIVKDFFAAIGSGDEQFCWLVAEDVEVGVGTGDCNRGNRRNDPHRADAARVVKIDLLLNTVHMQNLSDVTDVNAPRK